MGERGYFRRLVLAIDDCISVVADCYSMKPRYINPFTDFGFKKLFGEEAHKILLIDFLNALLPARHRVRDLQYTKNEAHGESMLDRKAIFDISCVGEGGERFIVEIQKAKQNFFKERSVFYSTFPIREQAEKGAAWNFNLSAVYCIGILDFVFDEDRHSSEYLHTVQLKDQRNAVFYDKLTFVYLEMPKFIKTEGELKTHTDKWLYFFKHLDEFDDIPPSLQEQIFTHAFEVAEIAQFTPSQIAAYEDSLKYYRDMNNVISTAVLEGEARGEARGKELGRQEEKLAIARNLKEIGLPAEEILKATGLSLEELRHL